MTEVNGRTPEIGSRILIGSQLGRVSSYDEAADRISYDIVDGKGINIVHAHISNTPFELLDEFPGQLGVMSDDLNTVAADVKFIAAPVDPSEPNLPVGSDDEPQDVTDGE